MYQYIQYIYNIHVLYTLLTAERSLKPVVKGHFDQRKLSAQNTIYENSNLVYLPHAKNLH